MLEERHDIRPTDITSETDMFEASPDLVWKPRVTIPLPAGDATFHNGFTPHTANANDTDEYRWAQVNIYIDRETTYTGTEHVVTDPLGLAIGSRLPDDHLPPVGDAPKDCTLATGLGRADAATEVRSRISARR